MVDLHAGEMEENTRRQANPEGAATPCRANVERCCKYGRRPRFRNHGHRSAGEYELNRNITRRKYQRSSHEYFTITNSRRREDAHKSKFKRRVMPWNLVFLLLVCFLLVCEAKSSVKGAPPRLIGEAKKKITATVGETVALKCMVEAEPRPLTSWSFNGKPVLGVRRRFKANFHLRIRDVRTTDSGRYRCTATNAFGSVDYDTNLVVRDQEGNIAPAKPRFVMPAKMRRRDFSKPVNSFLRLRCRASGHPHPEIEWYKNGNLTQLPGSKSGRRQTWIYTIRKLQQDDSGQYHCRVWNNQGEINYTYRVRVIEQLRERPVLLDPHPKNTTVHVGGTTAIQCRVHSRVKPTVKWIKRLDDKAIAAYRGKLPQNVVTIENLHYLILPTQEMLSLENESYLNKLVIRGVTEKHAGMYICMAFNTMGFSFKYAFLTVVSGPVNTSYGTGLSPRRKLLPRSGSQNKQGNLLPVFIGVPAGIGLLMVVFLAWCCHRRREDRFKSEGGNVVVSASDRLSALGSSETKSSTRSTPIPQDCEYHTEDNNNKESSHSLVGATERKTDRNRDNYYACIHRPPPTAGTPLLTVNEPDDSEYQVVSTDKDGYYDIPNAPPCSEVESSYRSGTEKRLTFSLGPPPPPPPSQKSASSLSSYNNMRPQYSHHYHYMHPSENSRRPRHHPHSRNGQHFYGY